MTHARINTQDWREAFRVAMKDIRCPPGGNCHTTSFTPEEVTHVAAIMGNDDESDEWLGAFRLEDGRFAFIFAAKNNGKWSDPETTGHCFVSRAPDNLIRLGLTRDERERLGLSSSPGRGRF